MQQALSLAQRGQFTALPNPMVGCILVKEGKIVGQGFHEKPGTAHAETHALREAGSNAKGASVYINLEPCCHFGRTPPCVDALIQAGIAEVFIAMEDPNPLIRGKSIEKLKACGIRVHLGLLNAEAQTLNRIFFHYITTQTPYVIGKWAMSLDGKMAVNPGDDPVLSSPESFKDLHELRQRTPGILIGSQTALHDNPSLTVRLGEIHRQPQRIVLNTRADLPRTLALFDGTLPGKTWLICAEDTHPDFPAETTEIIPCKTKNGKIDLPSLMQILAEREIAAILVEGGRTLLNTFFQENLVNEVITYITPWIIADLPHKLRVQGLNDILLRGTCLPYQK